MLSADAREHELDNLTIGIGLASLERDCHQAHFPASNGDFGSGMDDRASVEGQLHCGHRGRYDALAIAVTDAEPHRHDRPVRPGGGHAAYLWMTSSSGSKGSFFRTGRPVRSYHS